MLMSSNLTEHAPAPHCGPKKTKRGGQTCACRLQQAKLVLTCQQITLSLLRKLKKLIKEIQHTVS